MPTPTSPLLGTTEAQAETDKQGRTIFKGQRTQANAQTVRAFWLDLDVSRPGDGKDPAHVYSDRRAALRWLLTFCQATGLPSTNLLVDSGYGYHVYWVLEDAMSVAQWQPYAHALKAAMVANGYIGDLQRVTDAASILRPPETQNIKGGSQAPVKVIEKSLHGDYPNDLMRQRLQPFLAMAATTVVPSAAISALACGGPSPVFANEQLPDLNAAAQANLPKTSWFDEIGSVGQLQLLSAIAADPGVVTLADQPRDPWLRLLFSFADAEHRGAPGARDIALVWCRTSPKFQCEADFERDWHSFRPGRVTVATLLDAAEKAGFDLEPWRAAARGSRDAASTTTVGASASAPASGPAAGQSLAISALPTVMAPDHALDLLNQMFFFAHDWGGEPLVGHVRSDGVRPITEQHFRAMLANRYVSIPSADPNAKPLKLVLGKWWLAHPRRSEFDRVIYDPENLRSQAGERSFNLWTGFARTSGRGDWKLMARHIHSVICKRDRETWRYLIRWLAHAVQRPGTAPGTVPVPEK